MTRHFAGKSAIVTGGASGIGRALCAQLAAAGARVVIADIDEAAARTLADELTRAGHQARAAALDVTRADDVKALVESTAKDGGLDFMFNNAGVGIVGEVHDLEVRHWDKILDVNLRGVVHGVAAAYPLMVAQRRGHIVNTASIMGILPATPLLAPYSASKHAVLSLSRTLRVEGRDLGVRVTAACPGFIETAIHSRSLVVGPPRSAQAGIRACTPEVCAAAILRGVAKNHAVVLVPRHARVMAFMARWFPRLSEWLALRYVRKSRRKVGRA